MAIIYHPKPGQILMCDFSQGFSEPEMVKHRPVVVLTPAMAGRHKLVTVVACSTAAPDSIQPFHMELPKRNLPMTGFFQEDTTWLKGDMIYSVGFHRLDLVQFGKKNVDGKRSYFTTPLPAKVLSEVRACVLHGLALSGLVPHLDA